MVLEHFVQDPSVPALTIFIDPVFGLKLELGMPVQVGTPLSRQSSLELKVLPTPDSCFLVCPRLMEPHCVGGTLLGNRCTEKDDEMRQGDLGKERQTETVQ